MFALQGVKIEGKAEESYPQVGSRELKMEQWVQGPHFNAEGFSIRVLCAHGVAPLMTVSARVGRFYYAEKVQGLDACVLEPEHDWFMSFIERAKQRQQQQEVFLGRLANELTRLRLAQ